MNYNSVLSSSAAISEKTFASLSEGALTIDYLVEQLHLERAHVEEWLESSVDLGIVALNVKSLSGDGAYEYLIPDPRAATKKVHPDAQWKALRNRYGTWENGGWWVNGIDPLEGYSPMGWGSFKPKIPRLKTSASGFGAVAKVKLKPIKYEHAVGEKTRAIFLEVPLYIWKKIADKYNVPLPNFVEAPDTSSYSDIYIYTNLVDGRIPEISFWQWVHENNLPVTIVEGAKKAGALLTAGFIAIAIPGIFSGYRSVKDASDKVIDRFIIPDLKHFSTPGREFNICFDYETRPVQLRDLKTAITNFGFLLVQEQCVVRVTDLPGKEKGVDDFIAMRGAWAYKIIHAKLSFDQWRCLEFAKLTAVSVTINQRYLGEMKLPAGAKLVGIKSPKGTGKTEWLIKIVAERMAQGLPTILLTHRVQLGEAICNRLGLTYVARLKDDDSETYNGYGFGFGLCVDSLHPNSQARFNAESWKDALIIVDECEQVFWHTLTASTEVKKHRPEVISQMSKLFSQALVHENGGIILLDADLSDLSFEFVKGLAGASDIEPWIVENTWKPEVGRTVINYTNRYQLLAALEKEIEAGNNVMIVTQSQKRQSKFSTINLETRLRKKFGDGKSILRCDSETIADPSHPAFGCIGSLNEILTKYNIVICSPSLETGVSIDIEGHFSSVWAFMAGVSSVNSACQSVIRLRELVPLHMFAAKRGLNFSGNRSINNRALVMGQNKTYRANLSLIDSTDGEEFKLNQTAIDVWGKMAARVNAGMQNYRDSILLALQNEGHTITEPEAEFEESVVKEIEKELNEIKKGNYTKYCEAICEKDISTLSSTEFEKLQSKKSKTEDERNLEKKYELHQLYSVDVTPELVAADDDGLYPALRLQYYLTIGRPYLKERDKKVVEGLVKNGNGKIFTPDLNKSVYIASVSALEILGVAPLLNQTERAFRGLDSDLQTLCEKAIQFSNEIKDLLNITISKRATPIQVLRQIIGKLGFKLKLGGRDGSGTRQRYYYIKSIYNGAKILANWLEKDSSQSGYTSTESV